MRSRVAGLCRQIIDGLDELWMGWIGPDIEYIDLAVIQPAGPEIFAIVREPHVMCFTTATDGDFVDHFSVGRRCGICIDSHQFVRSVAQAGHAKRPDVHEVFLALDQAGHVGRIASLVGMRLNGAGAHHYANAKAREQPLTDSHNCSPPRSLLTLRRRKLRPSGVKSKTLKVPVPGGELCRAAMRLN